MLDAFHPWFALLCLTTTYSVTFLIPFLFTTHSFLIQPWYKVTHGVHDKPLFQYPLTRSTIISDFFHSSHVTNHVPIPSRGLSKSHTSTYPLNPFLLPSYRLSMAKFPCCNRSHQQQNLDQCVVAIPPSSCKKDVWMGYPDAPSDD